MKMRNLLFLVGVLVLVMYGVGCARESSTGQVADYDGLVANLRSAGATVESIGGIEQPFFSAKGRAIKVNGDDVQVFEYSNEAAAEAQAGLVSPDGSSIGTSMPFWVGPPHFFKAGKIIVLYVGENSAVISLLQDVLGNQFAGR